MAPSIQLVVGLRDFPRPRGKGFLYYKKPPTGRECQLVALDLDGLAVADLKLRFSEGLEELARREAFTPEGAQEALSTCETENMQDWATVAFRESVAEFLGRFGRRFA